MHRQYIICVYYYCADLMLSMHVQLLPQGGDLSVFLIDLLFNNVLHLHRLLSGSTFTVKVFSILLQLMWKTRGERREDLIALSSYLILAPQASNVGLVNISVCAESAMLMLARRIMLVHYQLLHGNETL